VREAHALDSNAPTAFAGSDGAVILDPVSALERGHVASQCVADLKLPMPALIDRLDDAVGRAYVAWPDRIYLVGLDGRVSYAGEPGPAGFDPDALEGAIVEELAVIGRGNGRPKRKR